MPPLPQLTKPEASGILLAGCFAERSASAMDHQCAQIAIAAFADTEQAGPPSTGSLFRHQAEPGRELPAVLEAGSIAHGCDQGGCRHRTDAFDLSKPLALLAGPEDFPYPPVIGCNAIINFGHFCLQLSHERTDHAAEAVLVVPDDDGKASSQLRDVTRNDNPMLGKEATNLIDESDPVGDQTPPNSMNGLDRQLISRLRWHKNALMAGRPLRR
jgi:hypothetical protein